jgi:hypothetical protein
MDTRTGFPSLRRFAAAALALITTAGVLIGARCSDEETVDVPPDAAVVPAPAGGPTLGGGAPDEDAPRGRGVVVYFQPGLVVRAEGLAFSIQPAADSTFEPDQAAKLAAALNEQLAQSHPVAVSAIFGDTPGEPGEEAPAPAFHVSLGETSQAEAEALAARLGGSPLVEEAYVPAIGGPPGNPSQ